MRTPRVAQQVQLISIYSPAGSVFQHCQGEISDTKWKYQASAFSIQKVYETGCLHFKTFKTNQPDTDELKQNHHVWCFVEGHSDYFWFINIIKLHFV